MGNLKKILALGLALVMMLSVMSVASAAFTDKANVSAAYSDAVDVLTGMGLFEGCTGGSFKPQSDITRAEVAANIYRIVIDENTTNIGYSVNGTRVVWVVDTQTIVTALIFTAWPNLRFV